MALATTNSGKYGEEGWDELWGGGEWAVVLPDIFEWRVLVIYRRRNRINRRREGKAKVDAV